MNKYLVINGTAAVMFLTYAATCQAFRELPQMTSYPNGNQVAGVFVWPKAMKFSVSTGTNRVVTLDAIRMFLKEGLIMTNRLQINRNIVDYKIDSKRESDLHIKGVFWLENGSCFIFSCGERILSLENEESEGCIIWTNALDAQWFLPQPFSNVVAESEGTLPKESELVLTKNRYREGGTTTNLSMGGIRGILRHGSLLKRADARIALVDCDLPRAEGVFVTTSQTAFAWWYWNERLLEIATADGNRWFLKN